MAAAAAAIPVGGDSTPDATAATAAATFSSAYVWWFGMVVGGTRSGWFPASYVRVSDFKHFRSFGLGFGSELQNRIFMLISL